MKRVICYFFGHPLRIVQTFSETERRVKCKRCDGDWRKRGRLDLFNFGFIPWNGNLERMYKKSGHRIKEPCFE